MAGFSIKFEVQDIIDRLKQEGWVKPVRCKDCKYRYRAGVVATYWACDFLDARNKDDGYCSYGKRRESDD